MEQFHPSPALHIQGEFHIRYPQQRFFGSLFAVARRNFKGHGQMAFFSRWHKTRFKIIVGTGSGRVVYPGPHQRAVVLLVRQINTDKGIQEDPFIAAFVIIGHINAELDFIF